MTSSLLNRVVFSTSLIILLVIYLSTSINIWAGDTVRTSVFLLNVVKHHTLFFDALRHSDYWPSTAYFAESTPIARSSRRTV